MFRKIALVFSSSEDLEAQILHGYVKKSVGTIKRKVYQCFPRAEPLPPKDKQRHDLRVSKIITEVLNLRMFMVEIMNMAGRVKKNTETIRAFQAEKDQGYLTTFEAKTLGYTSHFDTQLDALIAQIRNIESSPLMGDYSSPEPTEGKTLDKETILAFLGGLDMVLEQLDNLLILRKQSNQWLSIKGKLKVQSSNDKD